MTIVGHLIGKIGDLSLQRRRETLEPGAVGRIVELSLMFRQSFTHLPSEIESVKLRVFLFEFGDDANALGIVLETAVVVHEFVQCIFAAVAEGRMAKIVSKSDGFG